ncbi:MAG: diguanylate cyclase [Vulcanimicrobiota bacterium]
MPRQLESQEDLFLDPTSLESLNQTLQPYGLSFRLARRDGSLLDGDLPAGIRRDLPIEVAHEVLGYLAEFKVQGHDGPDFTTMALDIVTRETSVRYELQSTLEELISKYEELTVLYESAETVATVMNLDEVSSRILDQAAEILDVDHASLMLLDEEEEFLEVKAARGTRHDVVGKVRVQVGEEISGYVAREGKPVLIEDLSTDEQFGRSGREVEQANSVISVPLKVKDRILGVLNVNNKKSGLPFTSGDLKLLMALAQLAAISIQNARTYQNAITDRLTSLYNYGYFREQLDKSVNYCKENELELSLLMFDIDHFKNFNDVNGHELANVALVGVASLCVENCRQSGDRVPDLVARYGGEEFMVLLTGVSKQAAHRTAERIRSRVEGTHFEGGQNQPMGKVTISVGVATYPSDAESGDELINQADEALYRAKGAGRNNVQLA